MVERDNMDKEISELSMKIWNLKLEIDADDAQTKPELENDNKDKDGENAKPKPDLGVMTTNYDDIAKPNLG